MLVSYPPLEAYQRDIARLGVQRTFGGEDGRWVAACVLLQRFVEAAPAERQRIGAQLAVQLASDEETTFTGAGLRLAEDIEEAGALQLANTWLALLEQLVPSDRTLDRGRVLARRARVARKLGANDVARGLYQQVESLGESNAVPELTARAWLGYGVLAQLSGNNAENRRWCVAAALVADDTGCVEQSFSAHQGLMVAAGRDGDFDAAMVEGWRAFGYSEGIAERQARVLGNMSQILYETGRHSAALRGFAAIVSRTTKPLYLLAALGGAAVAAAELGERRIVAAAADRIERLATPALAFPTAQALLELAHAYATIGVPSLANEYRGRGREIAAANGFQQLVHVADNPPAVRERAARATRVTYGAAATQIISDIEVLEAPADLCAAA